MEEIENQNQSDSLKFVAFFLALFGNISLLSIFLSALFYPWDHAEFLSGVVIAIYFFEFLSLHSTGMLSGMKLTQESSFKFIRDNKTFNFYAFGKPVSFLAVNVVLVCIYFLFAFSFALAYKSWIVAGMFFISVLSKWMAKKSLNLEESGRLAILVMAFLFSSAIIIPLQGVLKNLFPISIELTKPGSGLFQDVPQTILAWGVIYFGLCTIIEYYYFDKKLKTDRVSLIKRLLFFGLCVVVTAFYWVVFF